jgi:Ni,Fe-hydrogenase III large subunit
VSAQRQSGHHVRSLLQDLDRMHSVVVLAVCAVLQSTGLDAVYVDIRRFRGYIRRTHNNLRALEGAADMKYMVRIY